VCAFVALGALGCLSRPALVAAHAENSALAKPHEHKTIRSFSVGSDQALTYPTDLFALPDEHVTFIPPQRDAYSYYSNKYVVFAAAGRVATNGGAVVLETSDLRTFSFAAGYSSPVMGPPVPVGCNPTYDAAFDEGYAAPGSVLQDPTRPPGHLIMIYEAENYCPGGVNQPPVHAMVGFARSRDNGKTWPAPGTTQAGEPDRRPVLQQSIPQPTSNFTFLGNAIPSAFIDRDEHGDHHLFVIYQNVAPGGDGFLRVARSRLGDDDRVNFRKWYNGAFSEPGIGGLDSRVLPSRGCPGYHVNGQISRNDDLGLYLMTYVCVTGTDASWYYSTATNLDRQDWTAPQLIENSQFPIVGGCAFGGAGGLAFDGWYASFMSPDHVSGHLGLTGLVFFMNGCNIGAQRQFLSRTFTITAE